MINYCFAHAGQQSNSLPFRADMKLVEAGSEGRKPSAEGEERKDSGPSGLRLASTVIDLSTQANAERESKT
jgi:hypothetical protein